MELIAIAFMLVAGGALAVFAMVAFAIARREQERQGGDSPLPATEREKIAASLLFHVLAAGGVSRDDALRAIRRSAGIAAPFTLGIDVGNWAESYARLATKEQRSWLLEAAVQLVAAPGHPVPLRQYSALLDLSFGLGFQTDALARLRSQYGFEYVDHAKDGRPREADHAPLFVRESRPAPELLQMFGLTDMPSRQEVTAAYRKLVAQHHPDRYHEQPESSKADAAKRFIELTKAYEELLLNYRD